MVGINYMSFKIQEYDSLGNKLNDIFKNLIGKIVTQKDIFFLYIIVLQDCWRLSKMV